MLFLSPARGNQRGRGREGTVYIIHTNTDTDKVPPTPRQHGKAGKNVSNGAHFATHYTEARDGTGEQERERERVSGKNSSKDDRRRFFYLSVHIASTFKPIVSQRWPYRMTNKSFRIAIFYVRSAKEKDAWRRLRHLRCSVFCCRVVRARKQPLFPRKIHI